jgi:hypothetical protein
MGANREGDISTHTMGCYEYFYLHVHERREEVDLDSQPRRAKPGNYSWIPHCNGLPQTPIAA